MGCPCLALSHTLLTLPVIALFSMMSAMRFAAVFSCTLCAFLLHWPCLLFSPAGLLLAFNLWMRLFSVVRTLRPSQAYPVARCPLVGRGLFPKFTVGAVRGSQLIVGDYDRLYNDDGSSVERLSTDVSAIPECDRPANDWCDAICPSALHEKPCGCCGCLTVE